MNRVFRELTMLQAFWASPDSDTDIVEGPRRAMADIRGGDWPGTRDFAERNVWNVDRLAYSALRPANLTTLAHFSVSSAMSLAKSAGDLINISLPNSAIRALTAGSASTALTSRLSRARLCPRHLRHEQPVGHALLEVADYSRLSGRD